MNKDILQYLKKRIFSKCFVSLVLKFPISNFARAENVTLARITAKKV